MAKCKFCTKEIMWTKEGRKNVPVEMDGGVHRCEEMVNTLNSFKAVTPGSISPEEIAKYEQAINEANIKKRKK